MFLASGSPIAFFIFKRCVCLSRCDYTNAANIYNYVGLVDLSDYSAGIYGLKEEGEDIRTHIFDFELVLDWCRSDKLRVLPLNTMILWLALNKNRLSYN